ncbi:MAG: hypothetical protein OEZ25_06055 [Candidatus Bathyarchaeota archaeon]|nr:hypothetical protein [Candidatus Bathyarchaeota archaeon]
MRRERMHIIEVSLGLILIVIGFILLWWSRQLVWIQIYPPPWEKQLIESLPWIFWILGALLIIDGLRRMIKNISEK